jgi:glycine/D-amino acid oxidase-like deaminating enzyme
MQISFWEYSTFFKDVDVVIIGSGIVGLNAALSLKKKNKKLKILILERGMLPSGASSKNAGFACFGSVSELLDDLSKYPENEVFKTVEKRWKGLERLRKNLGDKAIDFHNWGGYEIFDSVDEFTRCEAKLKYLNSSVSPLIGKKNIYKTADKKIKDFKFSNVKHMILNSAEGQIDTGKMITALIAKVRSLGVEILNGFDVKDVSDSAGFGHITNKRPEIERHFSLSEWLLLFQKYR